MKSTLSPLFDKTVLQKWKSNYGILILKTKLSVYPSTSALQHMLKDSFELKWKNTITQTQRTCTHTCIYITHGHRLQGGEGLWWWEEKELEKVNVFSFKIFSVWCLIHSSLIFLYGVRERSMWMHRFPSTICGKYCAFPTKWHSCQRSFKNLHQRSFLDTVV